MSARLRLEDAPTAIRPTALEDCDEQLALRRANREHTKPWDPTRDESFYTVAGQRLELELDQRAWAAGSAFAFAVLAVDRRDRIVGRVDLKHERAERRLRVKAFHPEPAVRGNLDDCLAAALGRLARLLGVEAIDF